MVEQPPASQPYTLPSLISHTSTAAQLVDSMKRYGTQPLHTLAHEPQFERQPLRNEERPTTGKSLVN